MLAKLSGASSATVAAVKHQGKYHLVAPEKLGGVVESPAESLTDCVNWGVTIIGTAMDGPKKSRNK